MFDWFSDSGDLGSVALSDEEQAAYDQQVLADSQAELSDATMGYFDPGPQGGMIGPTISEQDLSANQAAYQERLGQGIVDQATGDYQEALGRQIVEGSANTPASIFSQASGSLGDLARLARSSRDFLAEVTGPDRSTVTRPQQIFTPRTPSGSTSPNPNFSIFPARWGGNGAGVLGNAYSPVSMTGDVMNSSAAKIVAYAVGAVVVGWAVKKWVL